MVAEFQDRSGAPVPQSERMQRLAAAVRAAAARAADAADSGVALVFACAEEASTAQPATRLRAAAGFASAEEAREAAMNLLPSVREALESRSVSTLDDATALGGRAPGGLVIHPLVWEGCPHGALAVGGAEPLSTPVRQLVAEIAETLALRFDHARLCHTEVKDGNDPDDVEEKNEEILKLSEALFAQDIELLRTNEKLGKIEKLKSDFIERMSRELRTPLNGIIEAIISVLTGENEALSDGAKQSLRSALDDGTGFLRTLQNILDIWRLKQGELPVEIQEVNFRETVDEAIFSVQDAMGKKPIAIERDFGEDFPKIRTDLTKISQILFLLLENAVKFTPGGTIGISARVEDAVLRCDLSDTGIGICSDDRPFVFDEFFQVDAASSRRYTGSGLGLTLVRDLVVLLGGEIGLQSEVGRGSTFSFSLPIQPVG